MGWALNNQPLKYTLDSRYFLGPNPLHKLTSYYRLTVKKLWRMKFLENQLPFLIPENPLQLTWQVSSPEKRWDPSTPNHPTFQGLGAFFLRLVSGMGAGWDIPEWVEGGISSKKVPWLVSFFFPRATYRNSPKVGLKVWCFMKPLYPALASWGCSWHLFLVVFFS